MQIERALDARGAFRPGDPELVADGGEQLLGAERRVQDDGGAGARRQLLEKAAADRGLARADLAGELHESPLAAHAVEQVRERLAVLRAQVQKARVGREREGELPQAEVLQIHAGEYSVLHQRPCRTRLPARAGSAFAPRVPGARSVAPPRRLHVPCRRRAGIGTPVSLRGDNGCRGRPAAAQRQDPQGRVSRCRTSRSSASSTSARSTTSPRKARSEDLVLYDSRDLVTHAVCVGMTGSGKTGLCISLLEEAAIDGVPAIVIDPKGDLGEPDADLPRAARRGFPPVGQRGGGARARGSSRRRTPTRRPRSGRRGSPSGGRTASASGGCARRPSSRSTRRAAAPASRSRS